MDIHSPAFENMSAIPSQYTCEGYNLSPPLVFTDIPPKAKSLVLIVDDPDAPRGVFDHWIAWNIPATTHEIPEGGKVPMEGTNHFSKTKYDGPCPPPGKPHRYFFKLYAIDILLDLPKGASKEQVLEKIQGHIIGRAELVGTYKRH